MQLQRRKRLWKIRRELRKADAKYYRILKASGKRESDCTGEDWYADWMFANIGAESQEQAEISDELMYQAKKLYLPTPSLDDHEAWETDHLSPSLRYLQPKAMTELRTSIRKERAERREVFESWIKVFGGTVGILTGLVGALIGLIAIWKK